jgi:hypothetical protein
MHIIHASCNLRIEMNENQSKQHRTKSRTQTHASGAKRTACNQTY